MNQPLTFGSMARVYQWRFERRVEGPFCIKLHSGEVVELTAFGKVFKGSLKATPEFGPTERFGGITGMKLGILSR